MLLREESTLPSFLNNLENWLRISSIPYKHETNDDLHDLNELDSSFYETPDIFTLQKYTQKF